MTCAKQVVTAILTAIDGEVFVGTNGCENPQSICPRDTEGYSSGEGYHLCKSICRQGDHAEVNAIKLAGSKSVGAVIELHGHTYACEPCKNAASKAGVKSIIIK
jgi:deoxycytidylate deaminase